MSESIPSRLAKLEQEINPGPGECKMCGGNKWPHGSPFPPILQDGETVQREIDVRCPECGRTKLTIRVVAKQTTFGNDREF